MSRRTRKRERIEAKRSVDGIRPLLVSVIVLAAALRLWHVDTPVGGFHAFNEGNYLLIATNFLTGSLLFPTPDGHYLFLETPPLFPYVLALTFAVTGVSLLAARVVSAMISIGLVLATFLFGKRLVGERAGLFAAAIMAVAPVSLLTGRNVQTDSLFLLLLVLSLGAYLDAGAASPKRWWWFGALFGLALFTKLFAVVVIPAILVWEVLANRAQRRWRDPRLWLALLLAGALSGAFYGYQALRSGSYVWRDVTGGAAAATTMPASGAEWGGLALEAVWAASPFIALVLVLGVLDAARRRSREILFAGLCLLAFGAFYLFLHKHSYYLLAMLPFGAVLAGNAAEALASRRRLWIALLGAVAATGTFFSLMDLAGMKLGFGEFAEFGRRAAAIPASAHPVLVRREIRDNYGTVIQFYDPRARLFSVEDLAADPDGRLRVPDSNSPLLLSFVSPQATEIQGGWLLTRDRYALEVFGWSFAEAHANPHYFREGEYVVERTGSLIDFGFRWIRTYPAVAVIPLPEQVAVYRTPDGYAVKPIEARR